MPRGTRAELQKKSLKLLKIKKKRAIIVGKFRAVKVNGAPIPDIAADQTVEKLFVR